MKRSYKKVIFVLILFGVLSVVFNTLASEPEEKVLELEWPSSPIGTELKGNSKFPDLVKYLYEWGISLGGLAAFISLVMAGFQYLASAGDTGKMIEARDQINSAVLGLVLLLSSFLILETINPQLTIFEEHEFILGPPDYESIKMKSILDIQKPCKEVSIFADENCKGDKDVPAKIGGCTSNIINALGTLPNCIKAEEGNCNIIHLYTSNDCSSNTLKATIGIIENAPLSIKTYGEIRSIYIEKSIAESTSGYLDNGYDQQCETNCFKCETEDECEASSAECTWLHNNQCVSKEQNQD